MLAHTAYSAHAALVPRRSDDSTMGTLYRAAIGPINADYYLPAFERLDIAGRPLPRWNWAAALCTLNWLVFRQLWGAALVYVAALEGVALLVFALGQTVMQWPLPVLAGVLLALLLAATAVPGLYGDAIFHADVRKRITKALSASATLPQAAEWLTRHAATRRRLGWIAAANGALAVAALALYLWMPSGASLAGLGGDNSPAAAPKPGASTNAIGIVPASVPGPAAAAASNAAAPSAVMAPQASAPASPTAITASAPSRSAAPAAQPAANAIASAPVTPASAASLPANAQKPQAPVRAPTASATTSPVTTAPTSAPATALQASAPSARSATQAASPPLPPPATRPASSAAPATATMPTQTPAASASASASAPAQATAAASKTAPASRAAPEAAKPRASAPKPPAPRAATVSEKAAAPAASTTSASADPAPERRLYINVGLFADPANARRAHARLREAGLPATSQPITTSGGQKLLRVRVGPFASASQANAAAAKVRDLGLDASAAALPAPAQE